METFRQLFPLGKAYGDAFCNRTEEIQQLENNIKSVKHTLLVAPRRFGKSSLTERAIEQSRLPSAKINFHLATTEEEVCELILDQVSALIGNALGPVEKMMLSIKKYIASLDPILSFGNKVATLKLIPKKQKNYAAAITEGLLLVEKLLKEKKKKAVLFLDEFQEIIHIDKRNSIEGAIRTAAQEMQYLVIVFSGSIRALLIRLFEDERRPLYKLCRKIKLERISKEAYEKHIQKIAVKTWRRTLDAPVFNSIMELSNRHPYYVNYLCDCLWEMCPKLPAPTDVQKAWNRVLEEEWSDISQELVDLSLGQKRLLKHVANSEAKNLQSQAHASQLSMPPSSIAAAMKVLIERDYVEWDEEKGYQIINPLLLAVLRKGDTSE